MAILSGQRHPADGSALKLVLPCGTWPLLLFAVGSAMVALIPWCLHPSVGVACIAGSVVLLMLAETLWRVVRRENAADQPPLDQLRRPITPLCWVALGGLLLSWGLARLPDAVPQRLFADDFDYLNDARNIPLSPAYLLRPYNEHLCVFTRIMARVVLADDASVTLRRVRLLCGLLAAVTVLAMGVLQLRLCRRPEAVLATAYFAWSPVYGEAVGWFSASSWLFGLFSFLLAWHLVVGPRARPTAVVLAAVLVTLSLLNYTVSLVGALAVTMYLLYDMQHSSKRLIALLPAMAAAALLCVLALLLGKHVVARADYAGRSFLEAIDPVRALVYLGRAPGDIAFASLRIWHTGALRPLPLVAAAGLTVTVSWLIWCGTFSHRRNVAAISATALWLFLLPYVLVTPFRSWVDYLDFVNWGRYHLWPAAGLATAASTWLTLVSERALGGEGAPRCGGPRGTGG